MNRAVNANNYNPLNLSKTTLWILALSALITEKNDCRHDFFKCYDNKPNMDKDAILKLMKRDWGVTCREELLKNLDWLENTGHDQEFLDTLKHLDSIAESQVGPYIDCLQNEKMKNRVVIVNNYRDLLGRCGIFSWDVSRHIFLCRWALQVGFLTQKEFFVRGFALAKKVQSLYADWNQFAIAHVAGRQFWLASIEKNNVTNEYPRFKRLMVHEYSPWNQLDWNTPLTGASEILVDEILSIRLSEERFLQVQAMFSKLGETLDYLAVGKTYCDHRFEGDEKEKEEKRAAAMFWLTRTNAQEHEEIHDYLGALYYDQGDYDKAYESLVISARRGSRYNQYRLAKLYFHGAGIEQDYQQALLWAHKSEEKGLVIAGQLLGEIYIKDECGPNYEQVLHWLTRYSSDAGCYQLAHMYEFGLGVEIDFEKAIDYYRQAQAMGYQGAYSDISRLIAENKIEDSLVYSCYEKASDDGLGEVLYQTARILSTNHQNDQRALEYYQQSADLGFDRGLYALAYFHHTGQGGVDPNIDKAIYWYTRCIEAGSMEANYNLGIIYQADGPYRNDNKAFNCFFKAAQAGMDKAQFELAMYYHQKEQNKTLTKLWLNKACEQGYEEALGFWKKWQRAQWPQEAL